jgi:hypothetical protein
MQVKGVPRLTQFRQVYLMTYASIVRRDSMLIQKQSFFYYVSIVTTDINTSLETRYRRRYFQTGTQDIGQCCLRLQVVTQEKSRQYDSMILCYTDGEERRPFHAVILAHQTICPRGNAKAGLISRGLDSKPSNWSSNRHISSKSFTRVQLPIRVTTPNTAERKVRYLAWNK